VAQMQKTSIAGKIEKSELIMLSFNRYGKHAIFWAGERLEEELSENYSNYDWGDYLADPPKPGIWVWEGVPKAIGRGEDFEGFDFDNGIIREPTDWEWHCLKSNESPWAARSDHAVDSELVGMIDDYESILFSPDSIKCIEG